MEFFLSYFSSSRRRLYVHHLVDQLCEIEMDISINHASAELLWAFERIKADFPN